jgi:hypothetical protein
MSVPVTVFNATAFPIQLMVNGGSPFSVSGTGPNFNWQPQQPIPNPLSFTTGNPAPNVFGASGTNQVVILFARGPIGAPLQINIPQTQPINSLQLYLFFDISTMMSWVMLNGGRPISWGTILTDAAIKAAAKVKPPRSKAKV